jgi:hypothetical protein
MRQFMMPLHCESPVQSEYSESHVLSTQEHLEGQAVEEQSTSEADATAKVAKTTFMVVNEDRVKRANTALFLLFVLLQLAS